MKFFLSFLSLLIFSITAMAQSWGDSVVKDQAVYTSVDKEPVFPGGIKGYYRFIADHLQLPDSSTAPYSGKPATARIIVDASGKIVFARIEKSVNTNYNAAILKMISKMPAWMPGMLQGRAVATSIQIPVLLADFDMPIDAEMY
jgi:protein TonB